jgi:hypothetical protein
VPLHAAGIAHGRSGVLICATSRGGKTTLTLGLARRGWHVVGDDKLLLGRNDGQFLVAGVKHMLNVDPATREWFPEVGDLDALPIYSEWSPKRRVALSSIFPLAAAATMGVTHVVALDRSGRRGPLHVRPMAFAEILSTLLHQTVIPRQPGVARPITTALAGLAQSVRGVRVVLPDGAYDDPRALDGLEAALR